MIEDNNRAVALEHAVRLCDAGYVSEGDIISKAREFEGYLSPDAGATHEGPRFVVRYSSTSDWYIIDTHNNTTWGRFAVEKIADDRCQKLNSAARVVAL